MVLESEPLPDRVTHSRHECDDDDNDVNNNNNNNDNDMTIMVNPDQYPNVILKGRDAGLGPLRRGDADIRSTFFAERCSGDDGDGDSLDNTNMNALLLPNPFSAILSVGTPPGGGGGSNNNDDVDPGGGGGVMNVAAVSGQIYVTASQLLFVAAEDDQHEHDLAIGAACIVLHAMTDEPDLSIYLQLNYDDDGNIAGIPADDEVDDDDDNNNDFGGGGPMEVTITPAEASDCDRLFHTLCKMVSLHPAIDDDGDDVGGDQFGAFGLGNDNNDDNDDDDDELIWAPANTSFMGIPDDDGPSDDERAAMLERLDNLLVVRPEFEIQDGQFDDATPDVVEVDVEDDDDQVRGN